MKKQIEKKTFEERYELKPLKDIMALPTKRLLTYYKLERRSFYKGGFICSCCGEYMWDIHTSCEYLKKDYQDWTARLEIIKAELNTREHVPVKNKKTKIYLGGRTAKLRRCTAVHKRNEEKELRNIETKKEVRAFFLKLLNNGSKHE